MSNIDLSMLKTAEDKLAEEQAFQARAVNQERDRRLYAGCTINVTGYGDVHISGTPTDMTYFLGLRQKAEDLIAAGSSTLITVRDFNNQNHDLTPEQMVELQKKGADYVQAVFDASWSLKDNPPIPENFTDDSYWP